MGSGDNGGTDKGVLPKQFGGRARWGQSALQGRQHFGQRARKIPRGT